MISYYQFCVTSSTVILLNGPPDHPWQLCMHGTPPTIYERVRSWVSLAGLVSRVCPGGPHPAQWTVTSHNLWGMTVQHWMLLP